MLSSEVPLPSERSFGLTFAAVFGIVSGLAVWRGWLGGELWKYTLGISLGLLIFVLTVPIILRPSQSGVDAFWRIIAQDRKSSHARVDLFCRDISCSFVLQTNRTR